MRRDDAGATAIIIALCTVVLALMAGFVTDFGLAYNSKRQLQTSADAAALAAAGKLIGHGGNCSAIAGDPAAVAAAKTYADAVSTKNRSGRIPTTWTVACSPDGKYVNVTYGNGASTKTFFGGLAGTTGIVAERTATAQIFPPASVTGLRPYFVCVTDAQALEASGGTGILDIAFPNAGCGNQPGNWYTVDCPEDGTGNSTPVLAENTSDGCQSEITIVDTSAARDPVTGALNLAQEKALLLAACSSGLSGTRGCLTGNTGNLASNPIESAWAGLLGDMIAVPVFRADTVTGNGNNAKYPIKAILGVKVCGYKWQSKEGRDSSADCAGVTFPSGNSDHLWLKFVSIQVSGSTRPSPNCSVGDPLCTPLSVRLIQ